MTTIKAKKNGHSRLELLQEGMAVHDLTKYLEVISPGTRVRIGPKQEIEATIVEVAIKSGAQYRVTWWSGNERKSEWLEESEIFTDAKKTTVRLGFGVTNDSH